MLALSFAVAVVLMCRGHLEDKYRGNSPTYLPLCFAAETDVLPLISFPK